MKGHAGPVVNDKEASRRAEAALERALGKDNVLLGLPPVMGSEDFQKLAAPHPATKILLVWIGCGPANVLQTMKKGEMPAANRNPSSRSSCPRGFSGTRRNAQLDGNARTSDFARPEAAPAAASGRCRANSETYCKRFQCHDFGKEDSVRHGWKSIPQKPVPGKR